jgi:hypothetical protein
MDNQPVIDLGRAAELALSQMLEAGRVIGRDGTGRRVVEVPVDDWIIDRFSPPRRRRSRRVAQASAKPKPDHSSSR